MGTRRSSGRKVLDLIEAGRKIADVARDLGISDQTIYTWRRQRRRSSLSMLTPMGLEKTAVVS
ncbi:transposase [Saccharopolyspora sp. 5N708]|uniref:transposase n=1 Tax=Saccharopolyspora sp. 5N708 TaxID=3457424 RepID=UPI003FD6111D